MAQKRLVLLRAGLSLGAGRCVAMLTTQLAGYHNVQNALAAAVGAAWAAAAESGQPAGASNLSGGFLLGEPPGALTGWDRERSWDSLFASVAAALPRFQGVDRRFEWLGDWQVSFEDLGLRLRTQSTLGIFRANPPTS